jgi:hypothetical protein
MGLLLLSIIVPIGVAVLAAIYMTRQAQSVAGAIAIFIGVFIFVAAAGLLLSFGACVAIIGLNSR